MDKVQVSGCSSGGRTGHLLIGSLVVQSLAAEICMSNILEPKLLFHVPIGGCLLDRKHLGIKKCMCEWANEVSSIKCFECSGKLENYLPFYHVYMPKSTELLACDWSILCTLWEHFFFQLHGIHLNNFCHLRPLKMFLLKWHPCWHESNECLLKCIATTAVLLASRSEDV